MQGSADMSGGLEDRLRGLILRDTGGRSSLPTTQEGPNVTSAGVEADSSAGNVLGVQQEGLGDQTSVKKARNRRPNQAERRQRSAELQISIEPREDRTPGWPQPSPYGQGFGEREARPASLSHLPPGADRGHHAAYRGLPRSRQQAAQSSFGQPGRTRGHVSSRQGQGQGQGYGSSSDIRPDQYPKRPGVGQTTQNLYSPHTISPSTIITESSLLDELCSRVVTNIEIEPPEIAEKEAFRVKIETICSRVITNSEASIHQGRGVDPASVQLRCFGSLASGFATKASDLDLALLSPQSAVQPDEPDSAIPRLVEKALLDAGLGARLLTKARIPIIKVCEHPPEQLLRDLVGLRSGWERGVVSGHDEETVAAADEAEGDHEEMQDQAFDAGSGNISAEWRHSVETPHDPATAGAPKVLSQPVSPSGERIIFDSIRQGDGMSLGNYHGLAKRVLRKQHRRDITPANIHEFTEGEVKELNEFCLAFVRGLADPLLRQRLLSYRNLLPEALSSTPPPRRSLAGVYTQMEGERLFGLYVASGLRGSNTNSLLHGRTENLLRAWNDTNNRDDFGRDPLGYGMLLQKLLNQLRQLPSLQLILLAQEQHESAAQYHARASRLLAEAGGDEAFVIPRYVHGISKPTLRKSVEDFLANADSSITLLDVGRRHKCLQLAHEFQSALERDVYSDAQRQDVQGYIAILRGDPEASDQHTHSVIPLPSDAQVLAERIREIGNPALLAANLPRDRYSDKHEFPKSGAGVQCDINFSAHLALQNTLLLRCYSHTDWRVKPLVLFVKHWAKARNINTPYRGTLSSYGYVLMVLHYLVNVAEPFVCPNLQMLAPPVGGHELPPEVYSETIECKGRQVRFWRDEKAIQALAARGEITFNRDTVGHLLRGFFEYYAKAGPMSTTTRAGFDWGREVLSLRTPGGIQTKQNKGWTGAKTVVETRPQSARPTTAGGTQMAGQPPHMAQNGGNSGQDLEVKEVRHRYLLAIEDPFELDHNVGRTVNHQGIVAIRDEFRRAWSLIHSPSRPASGGVSGNRLDRLVEDVSITTVAKEKAEFTALLEEIHGRKLFAV